MENQGTCRFCGQTHLFDPAEVEGKTQEELNGMAAYECECEGAEAAREIEENRRFQEFAKTEVLQFMQAHDLKQISIRDSRGNSTVLLRMEKGDVRITTTIKEIIA